MVVHIAAATAASQAGATALGLGLGKTDIDLAQSFFRQQMQQTKRLWTVDYAESSIRHGEACAQSARQHAESQAAANAAYFQAERLAGQAVRLARDQDSRAYEMAWRAEVRESLRDELGNQNNRFNIMMLW
jgi:NAD(P)H-dependent flavin oxidoreductase YrpB (nitropropane dioxygenase family)